VTSVETSIGRIDAEEVVMSVAGHSSALAALAAKLPWAAPRTSTTNVQVLLEETN